MLEVATVAQERFELQLAHDRLRAPRWYRAEYYGRNQEDIVEEEALEDEDFE